ncbi:MAG: prolipoprotein diacylglyceryl transferase [Oscillospiraceae bacterium]|nr:prolipoprotein diacylglyceryl transferase [Oscillospiraceae bacterium]
MFTFLANIEFPKLGWSFDISETLVEFKLFGNDFSIRWYGLIIAVGFLLAVIYALRRSKHFGVDSDRLIDVVLVSTLFAFLGARLYFVLFTHDTKSYFENPGKFFEIWNGGLAIYGGIIFAFLTALWMCRVRKVNTLALFDLGALGFLIGQGIGRWGNFFNQEAFGGNTTLPWGMNGDKIKTGETLFNATKYYKLGDPVHPTFFYEFLWCVLGFVLLHILSKRAYKFKGMLFSLYLSWYGIGRFFIESLRADSLYLGSMKVSQLMAVLCVIGGVILFFVFKNRESRLPKALPVEGAETADDEESVTMYEPADAEDETAVEAEADYVDGPEEDTEPENVDQPEGE